MAEAGVELKKFGDKDKIDYSEWMTNLPKHLLRVPLNHLAIPGSHDSFTASLDSCHDVSPDCPSFAKDLTGVFGTAINAFIYNWSVTQSLDITEQLELGIRYFDFQVSSKPECEELYFSHGLYGQQVDLILHDVAVFLEGHKKEIVILDFNHFYEVNQHQHEWFMNLLLEIFGSKLVPLLDTDSVTLEELWENELQVIAFYHNDAAKDNFQLWPGSSIPAPWANTQNLTTMLQFLDDHYKKCRAKDSFHVTQGVLTPDGSFIMKNLFSNLKDTLGDSATQSLVHWLKHKEAGPNGINICKADFVESNLYVEVIVDLNYKITF